MKTVGSRQAAPQVVVELRMLAGPPDMMFSAFHPGDQHTHGSERIRDPICLTAKTSEAAFSGRRKTTGFPSPSDDPAPQRDRPCLRQGPAPSTIDRGGHVLQGDL